MCVRVRVYLTPYCTAWTPWALPCVYVSVYMCVYECVSMSTWRHIARHGAHGYRLVCVCVCERESMCLPGAPHSTARAPWALPCVRVSVYVCVCVHVSTWRHIARHGPLGHRLAPANAHFETKHFDTSHGHFGTICIHPVHHIHKSAIALPIDLLLRVM